MVEKNILVIEKLEYTKDLNKLSFECNKSKRQLININI